MSYFSDIRKASQEAERAAIEARKGVSPFAEYDGGKYEMMQYEGDEGARGYFSSDVKATSQTNDKAVSSVSSANISSAQRG
jgi:hypothetical protein